MKSNIESIVKKIGINTKKYWIEKLKTIDPHQVGVVKVSGKLLEEPFLSQIAQELSYMVKEANIIMPLVIGGGKQYQQIDLYKKCKKVNGLQITPKPLLDLMVPVAKQLQDKVVKKMGEITPAQAVPMGSVSAGSDFFEETDSGLEYKGYVGKIKGIDTSIVKSMIDQGIIPVISHMAFNHQDGSHYNVNATEMAKEFAKALDSKKLIIMGDTPVKDLSGDMISNIGSEKEFHDLLEAGVVDGGMAFNISQSFDILKSMDYGSSIHITSLKDNGVGPTTGLLEELLGDGSGTKISLPIPIIHSMITEDSYSEAVIMINKAFSHQGLKLKPNYFEKIQHKDPSYYHDMEKKGAAISYSMGDYEYMCKLITLPDYNGLGIATSMINKIIQDKGKLAWRTSQEDPKKLYADIVEKNEGVIIEKGKYFIYLVGFDGDEHTIAGQVSGIPATLEKYK